MNVQFFAPFIQGTLSVLRIQCTLDCKPAKPFIKGTHDQDDISIAAIIGLNCESFNGLIVIAFPKAVFLKAMGNMFGEVLHEITDDMQDGASELLNMIYGQAKIVLNDQGFGISRALPSVIRGEKLRLYQDTSSKVFVLPFTCEAGTFYVEICTEGLNLG